MLVRKWQCRQLSGSFPVEVPSASDPNKSYIVTVDPHANRSELHHCSCMSQKYRGRCKHQKIAHLAICGWNELDEPELLKQDNIDRQICPKCGGPIVEGIWDVKEGEENSAA